MPMYRDRLDRMYDLSVSQIINIMDIITSTVQRSHENGYTHGDISGQNIYLDEKGNAILGDFGKAMIANERNISQDWISVLETLYISLGDREQRLNQDALIYKPFQIYNGMVQPSAVGLDWVKTIGNENISVIAEFMKRPQVTHTDVLGVLALFK